MPSNKNDNLDDLEILEQVKIKLYEKFRSDVENAKVGDLLKIIELQKKLSLSSPNEKKFWEMIKGIRESHLSKPKKKPSSTPEGKAA